MQIAIDGGKRTPAYNAKMRALSMPNMWRKVILRRGSINIDHFVHRPNERCADSWHYDMSEWHYSMQEIS